MVNEIRAKHKISIYGAGSYAEKFLPLLAEHFDIQYIMDCSLEKQGTVLHDIPVIPLNKKNATQYPVVIMITDAESALNSLKSVSCTARIFYAVNFYDAFRIVPNNEEIQSLEDIIKMSTYFPSYRYDFDFVNPIENNDAFDPDKPRVFNMATSIDFDATGGPCACLRNLWLANRKYHLIPNLHTINPTTACVPQGWEFNVNIHEPFSMEGSKNPVLSERCESTSTQARPIVNLYCQIEFILSFFKKAHSSFRFCAQDIFLLQDPFIMQAFIHLFPRHTKVFAAYHVQGTLRSELGKATPELCNVYDLLQLEHLKRVKHWIFPSRGAINGFLRTASEKMLESSKKCAFHVAYNGYEAKPEIYPDQNFADYLDTLVWADVIFASATFLYRNKGVERIPKLLAEFKNMTGLKIHWVLIGGGEMEEDVERQINSHLKMDDFTWFKKRFDNQDNVFALFQRSDFYIMMHRVSVFDLSTLQSMSYGCVPILSNVDGNLELCGCQNGVLVDPNITEGTLKDALAAYLVFSQDGIWALNKEFLDQQKILNQRIVKTRFNNKAFLSAYKNIITL